MARFCPLASGSSGNSTYIQSGKTAVIIDAGISFKLIAERVAEAGGDIQSISGVAVTHTHTDHIAGLKALLQKTGAPLYCTKETAEYLIHKNLLPESTNILTDGDSVALGDIELMHRYRYSYRRNPLGSVGL